MRYKDLSDIVADIITIRVALNLETHLKLVQVILNQFNEELTFLRCTCSELFESSPLFTSNERISMYKP